MRPVWFFPMSALIMLAALAMSCSGDDSGEPTSVAPAATSTAVAEATASGTPAAASPVPASPSAVSVTGPVPKTIWLIDAEAGGASTLYEDYDDASGSASFTEAGDRIHLTTDGVTNEYRLDGSKIGPLFQPEPCQFKAEGEQIDGLWHPTFLCQGQPERGHPFISPDGEWFTYQVQEAGASPVSAMWALNLRTSERRLLQGGLEDCGGCDARFGPQWSPSGRYYYFAETGGDGRVFLTDLEAGITRVIAEGNELPHAPDWAPDEDMILYPSPDGETVVEDLTAGGSEVLENVPWPARFDRTGELIYGPAIGSHSSEAESEAESVSTTLVLASAYDVSSELAGAPEYLSLFRDVDTVIAAPKLVAALANAPDCVGIALYADGIEVNCIEGGQGAALSPDGTTLAVSMVTGSTGQVSFPGGAGINLNVYEIVLVDVETGWERIVADRAVGSEPPLITWNAESTHILVTWPFSGGL